MDALVLDGRYRIGRRLGEGGMGAVWEAVDLRLERQVAVKVMSGVSVRRDPRAKDRFDREAKLLAGLASPYVVTVHDAGEADVEGNKLLYLVMERLHGRSLSEIVEQELPGLDEVAHWAEQICRALAVAHDADVVHRDLKPANVMVCADGLVRVLDFGIAAVLTETPGQARLTSTGLVVGTPAYMAPEQIESGSYDARSDLYALGCMLYELVVGSPPFEGEALYALMRQHMTAVPELPSVRRPGVPREWDALIMHLLAKAPDDRPDAACEVAVGLRQLPRPEVSEPAGFVPRADEPMQPAGYVATRIDPRMAMLSPPPAAPAAPAVPEVPSSPMPEREPDPEPEPEPSAVREAPVMPGAPSMPEAPAPPETPPPPAEAPAASEDDAMPDTLVMPDILAAAEAPAMSEAPAVSSGSAAQSGSAPAVPPRAPAGSPVSGPPPWLSAGQRSGPFEYADGLTVELRWRVAAGAGAAPEVDGSALVVDAEGQVLSDEHFVFYNNPALPGGHDEQGPGVRLAGERGGARAVEHRFVVEPNRLDTGIERVVFALSLHEAEERGQTLAMLNEMTLRVLDTATGAELCGFRLNRRAIGDDRGVTLGELYRTPRGWGFHAEAVSYPAGLLDIAQSHGVDV